MTAGWLHGLWTITLAVTFAAIVWQVFARHTRQDYDEAARLPLDEDVIGDE